MKRLSIILAYVLLGMATVVASFSLLTLTSSTAYASDYDSDSDADAPPAASRNVNETRPAKAEGEARIDNLAGTVKIHGWDKNEVHVTGNLGSLVRRLDINSDGSGISIKVVLPHDVHGDECDECADLSIDVPAGSRVEA